MTIKRPVPGPNNRISAYVANPYASIDLPDGSKPISLGSGEIRGVLGEGGVAIVYDVFVKQMGVSRAVKLLKPGYTKENRARFEDEIKFTAHLRHPNIIEIHSVGTWNNLPLIEMEKIEGQGLDRLVKNRGALPVSVALAVATMTVRALSFTHTRKYEYRGKVYEGVLHRDLKPANIMIANDGVAKLMDFGIAKPTNTTTHTTDDSVVGSFQYMAPEQLKGKDASVQTDIYSFGCILYEMISGEAAFPDLAMGDLVPKKLKNQYVPLKSYQRKLPKKLHKVVSTCLEFDPHKRYETTQGLLDELEKIYKNFVGNQAPEQLVATFLNSTEGKNILTFRRFPASSVMLSLVGGGLITAMAIAFMLGFGRTSNTSSFENMQTAASEKPPAVPVIVPDESAGVQTPQRPATLPDKKAAERLEPPVKRVAESEIRKKTPAEPRTQQFASVRTKGPAAPRAAIEPSPSTGKQTAAPAIVAPEPTDAERMILARQALEGAHYNEAIKQLDKISDQSTAHILLKMQAVLGKGDQEQINSFFSQTNSKDAQYLVQKAIALYEQKQFPQAMQLLKQAKNQTAEMVDRNSIEPLRLYYLAQCQSKRFEANPSAETKQSALDAWYDVKFALKSQRSHPWFEQSNIHIREITLNQ